MKLTAEQMLEKYSNNSSHPQEVRRLAMMIFDGVNETLKEMSNKQRTYLENAALLHDIGYYIDSKSHNKHSQKMILDYGLKDFNERQKEIISCVCRYHRGSLPDKKEHEVYCHFDKKDRKIVKRLGGILRIADGLDRAHVSLIKKIRVNYDSENNITEMYLTPNNIDYRPDIFHAIRKKDLFELGFKTQVVFKFEQ
ncbi:MAG: HD domain-containing protein [Cyanobacteria bacterium SIG32]|nr:HD domain-containing protein [Cyanobacteria bacterium SIG32]